MATTTGRGTMGSGPGTSIGGGVWGLAQRGFCAGGGHPFDSENTQELRHKMAKKIAQLTKVIYALNTKNDENEHVLAVMQERHEEAMQQLMGETCQKLTRYKTQMQQEIELQKRVNQLQMSLEETNKFKREALAEFEAFKNRAAEKENEMKQQHARAILELSRDVIQAKREFEEQMQEFGRMKNEFEGRVEEGLAQARMEYEQEMQKIERRHHLELESRDSTAREFNKMKEQLEIEFQSRSNKMASELKSAEAEREKQKEEFEANLVKVKSFYEREMAVLRANSTEEESKTLAELRASFQDERKEWSRQEQIYKEKITGVGAKLKTTEGEVEKWRVDLSKVLLEMQSKDSELQHCRKQYAQLQQEASEAWTKLKDSTSQLNVLKEICSTQTQDLLKKSNQIGTLEAASFQNEKLLCDLQAELNQTKDKLEWLQAERDVFANQSQSLSKQSQAQRQALEEQLEKLSKEKSELREKLEEEMSRLRNSMQGKIDEIMETRDKEKVEKEGKHKMEMETLKEEWRKEEEEKQKEREERLLEELLELKESSKKKIKSLEDELHASAVTLEESTAEVARLNQQLQDTTKGLESAENGATGLREANVRLKAVLEQTRQDFRQSQAEAEAIQAETGRLKATHLAQIEAMQKADKENGDKTKRDIEEAWQEKLRTDMERLRSELEAQHSEDKMAALSQISSMKEQEVAAAQEGWQQKMSEVVEENSRLRRKCEAMEQNFRTQLAEATEKLRGAEAKIEEQLEHLEADTASKVKEIREEAETKMERIREQMETERKFLEDNLRDTHMKELIAQTTAHRAVVEGLEEKLERQHENALDALRSQLKNEHDAEIDHVTERLTREREGLTKAHAHQLAAAKLELERALELSAVREREFETKLDELRTQIQRRDIDVEELRDHVEQMQQDSQSLQRELESRDHEICKIKTENSNELRKMESRAVKDKQRSLDEQAAENLRETQALVAEFNRAQDLLKDKISALQIALREAEDRYAKRESRPEDLECIDNLRSVVGEREDCIRKLLDDKRFYQLELVNRETNFNRVFNHTPNVGVINPLVKKRSKGNDRSSASSRASAFTTNGFVGGVGSGISGGIGGVGTYGPVSGAGMNSPGSNSSSIKTNSAPALRTKLEPLPGSPLHDERLNPAKPLPPAPIQAFAESSFAGPTTHHDASAPGIRVQVKQGPR